MGLNQTLSFFNRPGDTLTATDQTVTHVHDIMDSIAVVQVPVQGEEMPLGLPEEGSRLNPM